MTDIQRQFLDQARRMAMQQIGREGQNPAALPYDAREAYATALSQIIVRYPARFDAQTVATAKAELADTPNSPLGDYTTGAAVADFFDTAAAQVEKLNPVPQLADSVKTLLKIAPFVLAAGFLIYVGLNAKTFAKK
jgi:hypothetical protein